ncbi:MAG TPA: sensor histidine kinase [Chloroflexota bacterium]|nr:sensor histidine kinase [Chloroflexota bacterium]
MQTLTVAIRSGTVSRVLALLQRGLAPSAVRHSPPLIGRLSAFGFDKVDAPGAAGLPASVLATFAASETFRWLRRWVVVAVVALATPAAVLNAYSVGMPESHHVPVPIAVAVIVPAWVLELSGVRWPRLALIAATVLPNVWLTLVGRVSTNMLWLVLLVAWVGFAGTLAESIIAFGLASGTVALSVVVGYSWSDWLTWNVFFLFGWFMGFVLRRQLVLVAELRLLREKAEQVAVFEERQRLSRELHDSVTQALYGISLYAEAGGRALAEGDVVPVATHLQEIGETSQEALSEMRLLLFELRPTLLQEHGLVDALRGRLQAVESRSGLVTDFATEGEDRLPPDKEQELYRIAQEALNNTLKHAKASRVSVRLGIATDRVTLEIADDGLGFEPSGQITDGFGLRGMRERVERLAGTLRVESSPGAGTRVHVEVPR